MKISMRDTFYRRRFLRHAKHTGTATPFRFKTTDRVGEDWRITQGRSAFLVAEGSGWSMNIGKQLFRALEDDFWQRRKATRPARRKL